MRQWVGRYTITEGKRCLTRPTKLHTIRYMLTAAESANRLGQNRETIMHWIYSERLPARRVAGRYVIELRALRAVEDELFPTTELPDEWKLGDDGSPALNWVGALHRSRRGS